MKGFWLFVSVSIAIIIMQMVAQFESAVRAKCADGTRSGRTCDKRKKLCSSGNSCRYLPKAGTHKWWCCSSAHRSRTCPNSGQKPRNQHCLLSRASRADGKKKKALYCRQNEMCFRAWWEVARGYGLCCKAYICDDGTEARGDCDDQCQGKCQKFQKYRKGIPIKGRVVRKCCGDIGTDNEEQSEDENSQWEAPFRGEHQISK